MSWLDSLKQRFAKLTGKGMPSQSEGDHDDDRIADPQFEGSTTGPLGQMLVTILLFPIQLLFLPLKLLGLFHNSGVDVELEQEYEEQSGFGKLWLLLKSGFWFLLKLPYLLVTAPIRFFEGIFSGETREAFFVLPAISMAIFFMYVFSQVYFRAEVIKNRYSKGVTTALADQNFALAKTYFNRLMQEEEELSRPLQLQLFMVLRETGEYERAESILDRLAPEDNVGFGPAHRLKAIRLAQMIALGREQEDSMESLGRHLNRTNDEDSEIFQAWSIYYRKLGKHSKAIQYLKQAARQNPLLYIPLSNYLTALRRSDENQSILEEASQIFRDKLIDDQLDHVARINLANIYSRTNRIEQAGELLLEGYDLKKTTEIRQSLASYYSMRYDKAKNDGASLPDQLALLMKALTYDQNHPQVYQRLMSIYTGKEKTAQEVATIKQQLRQIIASDQPSEIAHFALSSILATEGDETKAIFHLEQARKINPSFLLVTNNLAWLYAHNDTPKLEEALELADEAVKYRPIDGRFRDTRGSVLLKMEKYQEAITEFEFALRSQLKVQQPQKIHQKMSEAYAAMGMDEMAKMHLEQSKQ